MAKYLVTGGRQRKSGEHIKEWKGYDKAVSLIFDDESMTAEPFFDYISPRENLPDDPESSITFKSASIHGQQLIACTTTEVLRIDLKSRELLGLVSLPVFNDVHHVFINEGGNFVVTSTGLDAVFEVSPSGSLLNEWYVMEGELWERFDPEVDYRRVLTTKPHISHPNFCVEIDGDYWVTRHEQCDFRNLQTGVTYEIPFSFPHDGLPFGPHIYFTHVNGNISRLSLSEGKAEQIFAARSHSRLKEDLGWCRGLHVINEDEMIVGFTRIRPTRYGQALHWLKRRFVDSATWYGGLPTRLVKYEIHSGRILWKFNLEPHEINAVFSILPVPDEV